MQPQNRASASSTPRRKGVGGRGISSNSPGAGVPCGSGAMHTLRMLSQAAFASCTAREVTGPYTGLTTGAQKGSAPPLSTTLQSGRNIIFAGLVFIKTNANWPGWTRISEQAAGKTDTWNRGKQEQNQFFLIQPVMTVSMYLAVAVY